ncbi:MAG: right-handed parallel beta-helix repeat-containing protein [Planctomycetota bacterium]|jgi:predicted outer membrane repeat protein
MKTIWTTGMTAVVALGWSAHAATIYVDDDNCPGPGSGTEVDPYCSIQTAIEAAGTGDEILVAPGIYLETIDFLGKAITLRSAEGPQTTIIDAQYLRTAVTCTSGEGSDTVLEGFTITGGYAVIASGGGMLNVDSSPTVINCTFSLNDADFDGGGMYNDNSSPTVIGCTFDDNFVWLSHGGGMCNVNNSIPVLTNCTFKANVSFSFDGGGLYGDAIVTNCLFIGNSAAESGGGLVSGGSVVNSTFVGNTVDLGSGGAIAGEGTVANCIVWSNDTPQIATAAVTYSNIQGGYPGIGNIDADPLFVDPINNDCRLSLGSPSIDAGLNVAVPEGIETDLDGNPRFVDDPDTPDCHQAPGTCGDPPVVDMGAYEFQPAAPCPWDLDGSGHVATADLLDLLDQWGTNPVGPPDFDGDMNVGTSDLLALLSNWGPCP